jgi:hypothetical protein
MKLLDQLGVPVLSLVMCGAGFAGTPTRSRQAPPAAFADSRPSAAAVALFVNSNLDSARSLAAAALRKNPADPDALFVEMEAAALEADSKGEFQAALRLCETGSASADQRPLIAAARILDQAGNTSTFRTAVPRIRRLIAAGGTPSNLLRTALVAAAADGLPGLSSLDLARESGLITDWRAAGPFGNYPNVAFDRVFAPEYDNLAQANYNGRVVEAFRFYDGKFNLPDYFSTTGVFYAASDLNLVSAGEYRLRAESGGTLEIFLDGASVLKKDDRWHATPEIAWTTLRLSPGTHKLLVKFLPTAAPFRVALIATDDHHGPAATANPAVSASSVVPAIADPESSYVSAALRFWMGDYDATIAQLTALQKKYPSAALDFLLAKAWQRSGDDSSDQMALWQSALRQAPLAIAAEYELAAREYDTGHNEEAYAHVQRVVTARPGFVPGVHLQGSIAMELNAKEQAAAALEAELRLHSSCTALRDAARFFSGMAAYDRAGDFERQLEGCAPGSLAFAETRAEAGRHSEAAAAAQRIVLARPLDRAARALLVRELALSGDRDGATRAAQELVAVAPQSSRYRRLAEDVSTGAVVSDSASARARDFSRQQDFYGPYRRNGLEIIHKTASRHFSGGPALVVLHDRVARVEPDGAVSVYVHKITRVLNRDGIEKYGEVSVPLGADLLELRTVKPDGTLVEPEFNQHKSTISMPALAPGDAIELEYVLHYNGGIEEHAEDFHFTFGSFTAPMLFARFAVLTPAPTKMEVIATPGAPRAAETTAENVTARVWERQDMAQSSEEVSAPRRDALPTIRLVASRPGGWQDLRDFHRNELIDAIRIGPRVAQNARDLVGESGEETARNLYHLVAMRLRSTGSEFDGGDLVSAETTLADFAGNRTVALLAMARASGLDVDLLLARELDRPHPTIAARDAYTRPLVLFRFGHRQVVADAESEGVGFGVLPPIIAHDDALAVPVAEATASRAALIVPVPPSLGDEHSNADGDISFDKDGNMTAKVTIGMGASRSAQMRNILSGIEPGERRRFIEQIAMRIFPGAVDANGEVRNENDSDQPLELRLSCSAPHFLSFAGDTADLDQLAPALGLRKMYGLGPRHLPLYIDMPLVETTRFHVHLPAGIKVVGQPEDARIQSDFGSYSVEFRSVGEDEFDVRRSFRVPVQVIAPDRFEVFARFERQIDEVERQRVTLARGRAAKEVPADTDALAPRR